MRVSDILAGEDLIEIGSDLAKTMCPAISPASRWNFRWVATSACKRWRAATKAFCWRSAYSTQRGYARTHPFAGEIRIGLVEVEMDIPELGFAVSLGRVQVTECQMVNQFKGSAKQPPQFTRGYGLVFGQSSARRWRCRWWTGRFARPNSGEDIVAPAQDEEFVISHSDNVQATGFVEHLKLPHYVDFQAELDLVRRMRAEYEAGAQAC